MDCCRHKYEAVVIGASAGGLAAVATVLPRLKDSFCIPILLVQHISASPESYIAAHFDSKSHLSVHEAEDKQPIKNGNMYIAPPNYHMMIETDGCIALSVDPPVNFSRPSIDVLFETAADYYRSALIGIVLTGANSDGALGLKKIKTLGGLTLVQSIDSAEAKAMPAAAMAAVDVDHILSLEEIGHYLNTLCDC